MTQVLLIPGNPLDLRPEDLEGLVERIRSETNLTVAIHTTPQRGYGVTWWEILSFSLDALPGVGAYVGAKVLDTVTGHPVQLLLDKLTEEVKGWHQRRREKEAAQDELKRGSRKQRGKARNTGRPFYFEFRDKEGHVLRAIEMYPTGEIKDVTAESREKPLRPRPTPSENHE